MFKKLKNQHKKKIKNRKCQLSKCSRNIIPTMLKFLLVSKLKRNKKQELN